MRLLTFSPTSRKFRSELPGRNVKRASLRYLEYQRQTRQTYPSVRITNPDLAEHTSIAIVPAFYICCIIVYKKMGKYDGDDIDIDLAAEAVPLNEDLTSIFDPLKSGFLWYQPPLASEQNHKTGGHQWNIVGHDMQVLSMTVPGGESVTTEPGSFMYMSPFMETKVELLLCSRVGCCNGCQRICGGESCVKVFLVNNTSEEGYVGLTPNFPAKVVPVGPLLVFAPYMFT